MDQLRFPSAAALGMAMLIGCGLAAPPAQAGYVVALTQQGSDVVATGSGEIDLTGLALLGGDSISSFMWPSSPEMSTSAGAIDVYIPITGITGPGSFGSGGLTRASSGSGNPVFFSPHVVGVPSGYVSDSPLSDTATYVSQTFVSLGATPGTYEWKWGTGANQNFTLEIGATIPEPATWALLLTGFAALGAMMRARRRMATASI
jgi:hypothetical protein